MILACLCVAKSSATGAEAVPAANRDAMRTQRIQQAFGVTEGGLTTLSRLPEAGQPARVSVPIDGKLRALDLVPQSVRSPGYTLKVQLPGGEYVEAQPGPVRTMRGEVVGVEGSRVAASIATDGLHARVILPDGSNWFVEPARSKSDLADPGEHIVYRNDDVVASGGGCVALETPGWVATERVTKRDVPAEDVFIAELAVDTDYDYYLAYRNEPDPVAA
ncbi:MAG: hypothetical protein PVI86_19525, partial [Phycisphaerae bacterium]